MSSNYTPNFNANWQKTDLHSLAGWINGLAFKNIHFEENAKFPIIKINELKYGITNQTAFTNQIFDNNYKVFKGDLLFSWSGSPETSIDAFWYDLEDGYLNQHIFKVVPKEYVTADFIYYLLKYIKPEIIRIAKDKQTTGLGHITQGDMKNFIVSYPTITEQNKIVSYIKSIDEKIGNNLETNQTLEEIARTLFREWFINFNFPNTSGNLKQSEVGEIPESWCINSIGEICYVQNGYAFKSKDFQEQGEIGIIKIKNISGNVVDIQNTDFVDASVVSFLDNKFKIESGSLLIAMTGAEVGKIGLVPLTNKSLWLNQRVGMFKEKIACGNLFIYLLLSSETYQNTIQNSASGSAQPNISASAIESIRTIIPPAELIEAFGKTVKPMFEKILDNLAENEILKTTRDSLLPKLMSGEIEVNG
ncbi:restriction endonuclease subunit S [Flavobacterium sp. KACC 22761]|uniref:restriction endonuclease subunit S n=1 Tax=Flavobacterium sp. KACC 22761 TaxID=3092665 RepID=UPI002A750213|nr:restriction endonuclease subunit S [Flavobacterium sp. KACC 22761]WPO77792.1 restriction endonuclease subunit S [Flavobacterium sp. KACC 22761]